MTQQLINVGAFANDATGDPARTAFQKINANFTQLFTGPAQSITVTPTGTLPATSLSYNPLAIALISTSDNAADLTGNGTNIPSLVVIDQLYGGANINDGRNGLSIFTALTAPTSPTNAYRFYVGMVAYSNAFVNDNGTSGSPQGIVEAVTGSAQLTTGATNYFAMIGAEFTVSANAGSSVQTKALLMLDNWPTDVVHGGVTDTFVLIRSVTGAVGLNTGIQVDSFAGNFPLSTAATFIRLIGANTIFVGIDFGSLAITQNVLQWNTNAFFLSGAGNAQLAQGVFTAAGGVALTTNGSANQYAALVKGTTTAAQSFGLHVEGGTTSADVALAVQNAAASATYMIIRGDGSWDMGVPAGTFGIGMSNVGGITLRTPFSGGHTINGATSFGNALGVNGATPPAQVTGWGTATGAAVQNNFAGASAPLATCSAAIAKIITDLKAVGIYGA